MNHDFGQTAETQPMALIRWLIAVSFFGSTCHAGKWMCTTHVCAGLCSNWGESHYKTFDGRVYDFHGNCDYMLAKGGSSDPDDRFQISAQVNWMTPSTTITARSGVKVTCCLTPERSMRQQRRRLFQIADLTGGRTGFAGDDQSDPAQKDLHGSIQPTVIAIHSVISYACFTLMN